MLRRKNINIGELSKFMKYMVNSKKELVSIDFMKFICAFFVVYLHVPALLTFSENINYFATLPCKVAVPFFFLCSAYFLFDKIKYCKNINEEKRILKLYCKRLGMIWIQWSILYGICRIIDIMQSIGKEIFDTRIFFYYVRVFVQDFIFTGISEHLWYLPASIIGTIIVYLLRKKKSKIFACTITGGLLLLGLLGNTYNFLLPERFQGIYKLIMSIILTTRNGIFWAPIFILIGSYISDRGINNFQIKKEWKVLIISIVALIMEGIWVFTKAKQFVYLDIMISLIPLATTIFILIAHLEFKISKTTAKRIREMSLSIYLIHPFMLYLVKWIAKWIKWKELNEASGWYFLIVTCLSVLYAFLNSIKKVKNNIEG